MYRIILIILVILFLEMVLYNLFGNSQIITCFVMANEFHLYDGRLVSSLWRHCHVALGLKLYCYCLRIIVCSFIRAFWETLCHVILFIFVILFLEMVLKKLFRNSQIKTWFVNCYHHETCISPSPLIMLLTGLCLIPLFYKLF